MDEDEYSDSRWTDDDALMVLMNAHQMLEYGDDPREYIERYLDEIGRL